MRVAFTIIYEGLHHLEHLDFAQKMSEMFDYWIVVEGYALPKGSTKWCKNIPVSPVSTDGTVQFMQDFAKTHDNVFFYSHGRPWMGKDAQVNHAIAMIHQITKSCYLWQVDADEHWKREDLIKAEVYADSINEIGFTFQFNHRVGHDMIATGDWGSGTLNRLWKWKGQGFKSHEPALLHGQKRTVLVPGVKFDHYSYTFRKDVEFKSRYYSGHEYVLKGFDSLSEHKDFPIPISVLFGNSRIGRSNSLIHKINKNEIQLS